MHASQSRILLADDDPTVRLLLREVLEQSGFQVIEAEDGAQAMAAFDEHRPDMVLLDVLMPGMDGFETCAALRGHRDGEHLPIIMVTGMEDFDSIKRAYEAGATDFITKPINWLILSERVRYMLRASRISQQLRRNQDLLADAQRIARLGNWEWFVSRNVFHASQEFYKLCGIDENASGFDLEALVDLAHPNDRRHLAGLLERARHRGRPFTIDLRLQAEGVPARIVSLQVEADVEEDGSVQRLAGTLQDITERKMAELLEADRNRILQMVVENRSLTGILLELVALLERQRPDSVGALCLVQDGVVSVRAAPSFPPDLTAALEGRPVGLKSGCSAAAVYLGQTVVVSDIASSPLWDHTRQAILSHGLRSCFSVPIVSGKGQVFGTLSLYSRSPCQPSPADLELLESLARLAAVAVEQRHLADSLYHQAQHDPLTGLPNREALKRSFTETLSRSSRYGHPGAFLLIDLDRFKRINDSLGHQVGDRVLQEVAQRLKGSIRQSDMLGRLGGDEFVLILHQIDERQDAAKAARRILEQLAAPFSIEGYELHIGASIGISLFPSDGSDAVAIQKNADIAMYVAKNEGGNRFRFFRDEMNTAVIQRLETENDLRKAMERGELELHYQPQVDLQTGGLVGLEALVRWNHPTLGMIPPGRFIPVAEETRLIIPIGTEVLREACRQNAQWQRQGHPPCRVAVNVSAVQFTETNFARIVEQALKDSGLDSKWLEVEITETVIMKDQEVVRRNLTRLKEMGIRTTIDDFGTGYSSITYLRQMPLECLKIDRTFIHEMQGEDAAAHRTQKLVRAFAALAGNLGLDLVAEGVETEDQRQFLLRIGCVIGQGFLFSPPVPADEAAAFFAGRVSGEGLCSTDRS